MPTTAQLRVLDGCQFAHAVLIHGIELVFVDNADLVGFNFGGSRVGRLGLSRKGLKYRHSINLRKSTIDDNPWTITITDFEGDLARLFGAIDDSERSLGDVPLGGGLPLPASGSAPAALYGKHVGTERIGPAGERALYPSPSGFSVGSKHTIAVPGIDLAGAPVSDNPLVWNGRRVTLYRLYRDHVTYPSLTAGVSSWRPFSEAVVLQWGTLRDEGTVEGLTWKLSADGPESWLRKPLGVGFSTVPVRAIADVPPLSTTDGAREDGIGISLYTRDAAATTVRYGGRAFVTPIVGTTADAIRDEIIAEIVAAAAAVTDINGAGCTAWNTVDGYSVFMSNDGSMTISVANAAGDAGGIMELCLHRKVWAILGYEPELQSFEIDPDDNKSLGFEDATADIVPFATGSDYLVALVSTGWADWPRGRDNKGSPRIYKPQYSGGTTVFQGSPTDGIGQIVRLGNANLGMGDSFSSVAHPGQNSWPVADYEMSGGACDRQGYWLFFGKRRIWGTEEIEEEFRIAQASWRNGVGQNDGLVDGDTILVTKWLRANRFGHVNKLPWGDWIARASAIDADDGMVQAVPICVLSYREDDLYDQAHIVAQRLLYSTGTSNGWDGPVAEDPTLDAGDNEPSGTHTNRRDAEVAELGLGVPAAFIHPPTSWAAERAKVENDDILDVKLAFSPGYQALDALRSLLQPVGWSWHLRGGRYGIWCPADSVTQEDVDVVLTRSVKASKYGERGRRQTAQSIRKWAPIDKFKYDYDYAPQKNSATRKLEMAAPDAGMRYRPGEVTEDVIAHGMRSPPRGVAERVSKLSRFWARRHFEVKGWRVPGVDPGETCWPGTIIRITDPELVDALGEYGCTGRLGVVTGASHDNDLDDCITSLDLLVFADTSATPRVHAPSARVTAYDSVTRTLTCDANWLGIESSGTWYDAPKFSEPNYVGIPQFGGVAVIQVYQWDGTQHVATLSGRVVSTTNTTIVLSATGLSGTFMRDQDAIVIMAQADTQLTDGDWPAMIFSPVTLEDGTFRNAAAAFVDGYQWEP